MCRFGAATLYALGLYPASRQQGSGLPGHRSLHRRVRLQLGGGMVRGPPAPTHLATADVSPETAPEYPHLGFPCCCTGSRLASELPDDDP
eukprot:scaffold82154_cov33-Tisochrysis_lutea.AAC.3